MLELVADVLGTGSPAGRQRTRRPGRAEVSPRDLSWDPGADRVGRLDPSVMDIAGTPSISAKLDKFRWDDCAKKRFLAIKTNDIPNAIRR